jgi:peptide/nickel transport system ATP-binding protein
MNIQATQDLSIAALSIDSPAGRIVSDVSLALGRGRALTLLGESGSGKSLVAQAIMGNLPPGLRAAGRVVFNGTDLLAQTPAQRRRRWGRSICLLPQEPWLALDPTMRVLPQVAEIHRFVKGKDATQSDALAKENLAGVSLAHAEKLYPFQISGGMGQRAAIAMAHAADSELLIADEPTKGLDTALRDSVTVRLKQEVEEGRFLLTITHDVAVPKALGGMIGVMLDGRLVEYAPAEKLLQAPEHAYTKALLAAEPASWERQASTASGEVVLAGRGLAKRYDGKTLFSALDITIAAGEIVSVFGPSGCGKTTVGNILLGLSPPDAGVVERKYRPRSRPIRRFARGSPIWCAFMPRNGQQSRVCWTACVCRKRCLIVCPARFPAGSSSALRCCAPCCSIRYFSSQTRRRRGSIPSPRKR